VYAAGDVSGGIRQIVAAVHGGAAAALSCFEDLTNPYYKRT
jgi:thioredoxin reductase (NADPH)